MSDLLPVVGGPWHGRVVASPEGAQRLTVAGRGCVEVYARVTDRRQSDGWAYVGRDVTAPTGFVVFT